jgi:hypothetical protein
LPFPAGGIKNHALIRSAHSVGENAITRRISIRGVVLKNVPAPPRAHSGADGISRNSVRHAACGDPLALRLGRLLAQNLHGFRRKYRHARRTTRDANIRAEGRFFAEACAFCEGVLIHTLYTAAGQKGGGRGLRVPLRAPPKNITCLGTALQTHTHTPVLLFFLLRCSILSLAAAAAAAPKSLLPHANSSAPLYECTRAACGKEL